MALPVLDTIINRHAYDWSSIELTVNGIVIITQFNELSYSQTLEPGFLRGNKPQKLGRTRGELDNEGSCSMYLDEWKKLRAALLLSNPTKGFMEISFLMTIMYLEPPGPPTTDVLQGCRITAVERSHSQGNEPLMVNLSLDIMRIIEDGTFAVLDNVII